MRLKSAGNLLIISLLLFSCNNNGTERLDVHTDPLILGKATPIQLNQDSTAIIIADFVLEPSRIDSISNTGGLTQTLSDDKLILTGQQKNPLSVLTFWSSGLGESVMLVKSSKSTIGFTYTGLANEVKIKGEFNAWNANSNTLHKDSDSFRTQITLAPGNYQYLMVVDGKEMRDPTNPDSVDNGMGGWNSILRIPRADESKLPLIKTISKDPLTLQTTNPAKAVIAFWNNYLLPEEMVQLNGNEIKVSIPVSAKAEKRSHIRVWAFNDEGISNDVLIPLNSNEVLDDVSLLTREDREAMVMYFLMVDRFKNGNSANDKPLKDPMVNPKVNFFGGDLSGVTQEIQSNYFQSLGVNTIWLSPITQNPETAYGKYPNPPTTFSGYHGYWPISSSKVDHRFGTSDEMHELIKEAHKENMNVILDYVANHVHELHPLYKEHKDWATDLYLPDGTLNTERWDDHRLTTWFDTFMPTLDLSRMEVVDPMTDSALFWVENYGIDGYRHDATKHIPEIFWRTLTKKAKERITKNTGQSVFQIGETYGSRELINSYISTGMLDAQFDFNVYDDAVATFARNEVPFSRLTGSLKESIAYYGDHNLMGYITGNQDRARFISYADGSLRFDEDTKLAGWTRDIEVRDTIAYQKLSSLTAFMMTIPGIPTIYYGDEYGSPGGNDPDNRRMMRFTGLNKYEEATKARAEKLIHLRTQNLALIYGDFEIIEETANTLILKRSYFNNSVIAVFNKSDASVSLNIGLSGGSPNFYGLVDNNLVSLPPYSFDVITFNN
ncbi:MAG TPA: alpha-amylase family glycosyl hydrolase [Fulvivirga sp.]|nr:alpha-amylase family glycosyl hydrolase [Fulvivirga sp.]